MEKALIIFSGGQDSTTCLGWALKEFDEVECITFDYGQKHSIELVQARNICAELKVKLTIVPMLFLHTLVESALTDGGDVNKLNAKGLPASFVPNRNQLFFTLAHAYAQKIGAEHLVIGACETDFSGYPDCRKKFLDDLAEVTNVGSDSIITLHYPLMHLTKGETFHLAKAVGILDTVINDSHTCYNGDRTKFNVWGYGCGDCPACNLREKGYNEFLTIEANEKNS